jgi:hypothetical protein
MNIGYNIARKDSESASRARDIMQKKIDEGRSSAMTLLQHVHNNIPDDKIARGSALSFDYGVEPEAAPLVVRVGGGEPFTIHPHAVGQTAQKAGIPERYLKDLIASPEAWRRELAARTLNDHFNNDREDQSEDLSTSRHLIRVVHGNVGPLDAQAHHLAGDGLEHHRKKRRLWCLNGATMEDALSQVHLGGRMTEDIEFTDRTYRLDTAAQVSALRDVVKGSLGPKNVNNLLDTIKNANDKEIDWKNISTKLSKKLLKEELKAVRDAFESEDVINLPPQKSLWRASNAVSWIAGHTEDNDRKLELQRLAGEVIHGKSEVAEAA